MAVLTDTTVLSNFAHVRRPDLLREIFPDLVAPPAVFAELGSGERLGLVPVCDWAWLKVVELTESEQAHAAELRSDLEAGEAACLAIARSRGWLLLLTDDGDARRRAQSLGNPLSGTLGALARLVRQAALSVAEADRLLAKMRQCGYRSPVQSVVEVLGGH